MDFNQLQTMKKNPIGMTYVETMDFNPLYKIKLIELK